jgi:hypothetical protein
MSNIFMKHDEFDSGAEELIQNRNRGEKADFIAMKYG